MRISVVTGVLTCALVFTASSTQVGAVSVQELQNQSSDVKVAMLLSETSTISVEVDQSKVIDVATSQETEKIHTVEENESLSEIAKKYGTNWKRIYDKNTQIVNPDIIDIGDKVTIPSDEEELESRELPTPVVVVPPTSVRQASTRSNQALNNQQSARPQPAVQTQSTVARGASDGNLYTAGYCTWYVKNRRPDLPNNLGNAETWVSRAAAQGMATGSTPRASAVGQRGNHVVYVESVNSDGTVTISEMNHKGLYVQTTRTLPANYFSYIY